jgi:hypothetical protein
MQSALAEMSIDDASKDLDDDVEFVDVMGMYSDPTYKALILVQSRMTFLSLILKARMKKLRRPRWLQVKKRCRMKSGKLGKYAQAISLDGSYLRDILASEIQIGEGHCRSRCTSTGYIQSRCCN